MRPTAPEFPPALLLLLSAVACASPARDHGARVPAAAAVPAPEPAGPEASPAPSGEDTPAGVVSPPAAAPGASPAPAPFAPAPSLPPERRGPPLPELRVKSFGLHVGGSSRDAASRDEFLRTLERASSRYLDCYRLIESPGASGTYGADLHVPGSGGKARVAEQRTKLPGESFRACMAKAFESVTFPAPPSGRSVVVSYSVKFTLAW